MRQGGRGDGGWRRQGDVTHFCELRVARKGVEGFRRLAVCVVDIVHDPNHDISCMTNLAVFADSTMRLHYYNTFVYSSLCRNFPLPKCSRKNLHISDTSRQYMRERDQHRIAIKNSKANKQQLFVAVTR